MKKILLVSAVASLALGLTACGKVARLTDAGLSSANVTANTGSSATGASDNSTALQGTSSTTGGGLSVVAGSSGSTGTSGTTTSSTTVASSGSTATNGAILAYFSNSGTIPMDINSANAKGTGTQYLNFQDVRDSATAKDANVATINVTNIVISMDPSYAALFANYQATTVSMSISYVKDGVKTVVGITRPSALPTVAQIISGISMLDNTILIQATNFATFQSMISGSYAGSDIILDLAVASGTLPDASIVMNYSIEANAKVNVTN